MLQLCSTYLTKTRHTELVSFLRAVQTSC